MGDFINEFILRISPLISEYGAWGVFFVSLIEEIIVPIPSSFILLAAGFFLLPVGEPFTQVLMDSLFKIVIPGSIGLTLGSVVIYMVGYLGGEPAILKWGKWFGVSWKEVEGVQKNITRGFWDEVLILGSRTLPILPQSLISFVCGVIRYPPHPFIVMTFFGTVIRTFFLSLLGWSFGEAYVLYSSELSSIGNWIIAILAILIVAFIAYRILKKRKVL